MTLLALAELRRNRGRYASITVSIGFIVFLVLILAGLADGLYFGATGAYRSANADLYSFGAEARSSIVRSELGTETIEEVRRVPGVADAGGLGLQLGASRVDGTLVDVALFGHEPGHPGAPTYETDFGAVSHPVAVADTSLRAHGVDIGDEITLIGSTTAIEVVEFVDDSAYLLAGTLWTDLATWQAVRTQMLPEVAFRGSVVEAIAATLKPGADPAQVGRAVDAATGSTETVTPERAIGRLPGVEQQQATFRAIIITSFVVVAIVTGLFFALVTLEKRGLIAVLKAVGATNRSLLGGILIQGALASLGGFAAGWALSRLVGLAIPAVVPLTFLARTAQTLFAATVVMGSLGAALSFRWISRTDPATALGGEP